MAVGDTYEFAAQGVVATTQHIHTLHFRSLNPVGNAAGLITAWSSGALTQYRACFSINDTPTTLLKARAVCGTEPLPAGAEVVPTPSSNTQGTRATGAEKEPAFVACTVRELSDLAGRSRQGRFFLGGLQDADVLMNNLATAYVTIVQAYASQLMTVFGPNGTNGDWRLVVHSRKLAQPGVDCLESSTPVTSLVVTAGVTTMRSRKVGHGV